MSVANRSLGRNVHLYDAREREKILGGLILTNGITNASFYSMVGLFITCDKFYYIRDETDIFLQRDSNALQPGNYYINTRGTLTVSDERCLVRTISVSGGTRVRSFRDEVRERDRRCVITGREAINAEWGDWATFEAAHIFPLAYESHWTNNNYGRWITIEPAVGGSINSVQNGILLDNSMHALFGMYAVSINPDDDYKIVCFRRDMFGVAGRHLDQRFRDDERRPTDELMRWHFRQAVLANMRGAGEPIFETDFPPGQDMVGEILSGPKAGERMEFELFSRLVDCHVTK